MPFSYFPVRQTCWQLLNHQPPVANLAHDCEDLSSSLFLVENFMLLWYEKESPASPKTLQENYLCNERIFSNSCSSILCSDSRWRPTLNRSWGWGREGRTTGWNLRRSGGREAIAGVGEGVDFTMCCRFYLIYKNCKCR